VARKRPLVRNRDLALYGGLALWLAGAVLLKDAYERRGKGRPAALRVVGAFT
jgi:hypothetical protein